MHNDRLIQELQENWLLEMDGVDMYAGLAKKQPIPERTRIFRELSELERKHALQWQLRLEDLGAMLPIRGDSTGHDADVSQSSLPMQEVVLRIMGEERDDVSRYLKQLREIDDEPTRVILRSIVLDEFAHAHVLSQLYAQSGDRGALAYLARRRRNGTGSWIGDAVYGVNDGLGSIFGIVSGVSGATVGNSKLVLLAGLAGVVASALSMGSGAYLAAKSEREIFEAELYRERLALEENPEGAKEELALFYKLKGVPDDDATKISEYLVANPDQFLRTMTAEKLNLTEAGLSNPITSAVSGSVSTAIGAFIPIIPFFFMSGVPAVIVAACVSLVAHFVVGAAKSLVTVRSWWSSGLEMTLVGAVEGIVTYFIGVGLGNLGA